MDQTISKHSNILIYVMIVMPIIFLPFGCSFQKIPQNTELVIFAASSLTNAFEELALRFEENHPGTNVVLNFSSSSQLGAQIQEGVRGDIFASANEAQMAIVQDAGEIIGEPTTFCTNSLVIGVPKNNPFEIGILQDLTNPSLRLVLATPGTPIREYTDMVVKRTLTTEAQIGFYNNLVSEEANVRQVVTKIALGEADAGIIYASDITPDIVSLVIGIPIPPEDNITANYPIAILNQTQYFDLAIEFIQFLISDEGQNIFQKWGFGQKP